MKMLKVLIAGVYIIFLCYLVFFARRREAIQDTRRRDLINVVPIVNQVSTYQGLAPHDYRGKRHFVINLLGNIALFIPFPVFAYSFGLYSRKKIFIAAFLATLGIETIQLFFHIGVPDIDDVLLNLTGAYLGVLFLRQVPVSVRSVLY